MMSMRSQVSVDDVSDGGDPKEGYEEQRGRSRSLDGKEASILSEASVTPKPRTTSKTFIIKPKASIEHLEKKQSTSCK